MIAVAVWWLGISWNEACAIDGEMLEGDLNFDDNFWVRSFVCG